MFSVNSFFLSFSANVIFSFSKPLRSNPNESKKSLIEYARKYTEPEVIIDFLLVGSLG